MAKNYAALARSVIAALGGVDNISRVPPRMTQLRFGINSDQSRYHQACERRIIFGHRFLSCYQ
ncbi:hypothetical protein C5Y89_27070 [Escherichia coli]|nr:hypothetical protein C5Y89_27070 [Escherichia coli]